MIRHRTQPRIGHGTGCYICLCSAAVFLLAVTTCASAHAQAVPNLDTTRAEVSVRYAATRANSPPGSCGCFYLQGAAMDVALPFSHHWSAALEAAGNHAGLVPGTTRGLSTITLLAGPRYTHPFGLRHEPYIQGLFGAVRGFDASFPHTTDTADTATALAFAVGGGYAYRLSRGVTLLPLQVDFVQTDLPNGADGRQRNLRFSAGARFRISLGASRR